MNVEKIEVAIDHTAHAFGSGLKALLHFFAAHTSELAKAAEVAETATGNAELIPLTETVAKATQSSASILDEMVNK